MQPADSGLQLRTPMGRWNESDANRAETSTPPRARSVSGSSMTPGEGTTGVDDRYAAAYFEGIGAAHAESQLRSPGQRCPS